MNMGLRNLAGFTIIELVVVIILLGIMAVTVIPKFYNSNGFEEFTYQAEVITKLRNIQLRAMQQTDDSQCHKVVLTNEGDRIGLMANDSEQSDNCHVSNYEGVTTSVILEGEQLVLTTNASDNTLSFDSMGRPLGCSAPCEIIISNASNSLIILIEAQGYIHAG